MDGSVERQLGILIGKLEGIEDRLERADVSRATIHQRLDEVVMWTTHVEADISSLKHRTDAMQGVTDDMKSLREKALGAGTAGRVLIHAGIAIVTFAGWALGIYTWLTGRPPP